MADIKTKDNAKGTIRTIDKAAVATQRMKQAYIATKEKAERSVNANSSSAEEYASDKLESGIDEVFHDGAYAFDKAGRKGLETVPFPVSWTVKMKKKQKETQDILSYHTQAAGCSDKARAKASGGRQPIEECGRTGL